MKLPVLTLLLIAISFGAIGQKKYTYYFDKNLNPTTQEKAFVYGKGIKTDTTFWAEFYLMSNNSKIFSSSYTDSSLAVQNGPSINYYADGRVEQLKYFKLDVQDGLAKKWDIFGRLTDSMIYKDGLVVFKQLNNYSKYNLPVNQLITDSINNTMLDISFDSLGRKTKDAFFVGDKGVEHIYNIDGMITNGDSLFTREHKDAGFKGGSQAWLNYLVRNLDGSVPYKRGAPAGNYPTIVQFIIEKDGTISNMKSLSNVGYGMDEEAMRVIKAAGQWEPAKRYGKPVKAYHKQPITFQVMQP